MEGGGSETSNFGSTSVHFPPLILLKLCSAYRMSDSVLDDQDCATAAIDSSTRLVTAYSRQDSLLQQSKEKEIQLAARRRARHIVEHWDEMEEEPEERRGRLEGRIQQLSKEKRSILQRQTIASGAVRA